MSDRHSALHVRRGLGLSTPSDDEFRVETAWFWAGPPATMRVSLDWQQWERTVREALFGLDDRTVPTDLVPDNTVVLNTRLDPSSETAVPDDEQSLRARLADPDDPLARTESWVATDVRQHGPLPDAMDLTDAVFDDGAGPTGARDVSAGGLLAGTDSGDISSVDVSSLVTDDATVDPDVSPALGPVVDELDDEGWPYEVTADGSRVSLVATLEGRAWDVHVEPTDPGETCTATSVHPDGLPDADHDALATRLLEYNTTVDTGGFELTTETGVVRFRTAFVSGTDRVRDVLREHATAMAEWYDRIAG